MHHIISFYYVYVSNSLTFQIVKREDEQVSIAYVKTEMNPTTDFYCLAEIEDTEINVPIEHVFHLIQPKNEKARNGRRYGYRFLESELNEATSVFLSFVLTRFAGLLRFPHLSLSCTRIAQKVY